MKHFLLWRHCSLLLACLCLLITLGCFFACNPPDTTADTTPSTATPTSTEPVMTPVTTAAITTEDMIETKSEPITTTVTEPATQSMTQSETEPTIIPTTAPVTDLVTNPVTEPTTEEDTMPETTPPTPNEAERARLQAMLSEEYAGHTLPIGGWSTPATTLRDDKCGIPGSYDRMFGLLADAGLNFMITLDEWSSPYWSQESLSSAKKAGMKLWYNCTALDADAAVTRLGELLASENADALGAIYVKDEPTFSEINSLASTMEIIQNGLGESVKLPYLANLLPTYATTEMVTADYRGYVRTYLDTVSPNLLMFDFYPYQGTTGDQLAGMMANIAIAREEAGRVGIPLYTFLQSSGWPGMREPTTEEIRAHAHINLAMGVKGFAYFLACEHYDGWEYSAMLDADGQTTALYDKVKTVNSELDGFAGSYLDFEHKGILLVGYNAAANALTEQNCSTLLESFGSIEKIVSRRRSKTVVGCFEDTEGHEAYYVVNAEYTHATTVTLTLDEAQTFAVWTKDGVQLVESTDTLELNLEAGDAVFVVKFDVNIWPDRAS